MTQLSTVAYERQRQPALATPVAVASTAVALVLGMGLGLLVSNLDARSPAQQTGQAAALTHEKFLRMNTEDLDHLVRRGFTAPAVAPTMDPFTVRNVDSHEWPAPTALDQHAVDSHFYDINTSGFESPAFGSAAPNAPGDGSIGNTEPFGYPNYGRLETYLGAQATGGVR